MRVLLFLLSDKFGYIPPPRLYFSIRPKFPGGFRVIHLPFLGGQKERDTKREREREKEREVAKEA
jgi:hypothetical protein